MKKQHTTRVELTDAGDVVERLPDGTTRIVEDETDWERVRSLSEEQIIRAAEQDPDAQPLTMRQLEKGFRVPNQIDVRAIRARRNMSQRAFAATYGFSVDALQEWEQGRKSPSRMARVLLTVIACEPEAVERALSGKRSA